MSLGALEDRARAHHLANFGAFNLMPEDGLGDGALVLLGPDEPGFWAHVTAEAEFLDGGANPLDRWSQRVITALAQETGGTALFPFGQPMQPFLTWALRSGRAWSSPVAILVHDVAGLMVSYRGAVVLPGVIAPPPNAARPCDTCQKRPCLTACPPRALTGDGYDVPACHRFLDTDPGQSCQSRGCAVRRTCPAGAGYGRVEAQSAYHMGVFHT